MSPLEIAGFVFGIAGVWLTIKEHWTCFPVGLVNVIISMFLFLDQKLYSDSFQQMVYIVLLSYGWFRWKYQSFSISIPVISYTEKNLQVALLITTVGVAMIMGYTFKNYTDASVPYLDAIATAMSFTAQYLVARKKIENWFIWMAVNLLYTGIYCYKGLYLYVILFAVYFVLAIKGYVNWKKSIATTEKFSGS